MEAYLLFVKEKWHFATHPSKQFLSLPQGYLTLFWLLWFHITNHTPYVMVVSSVHCNVYSLFSNRIICGEFIPTHCGYLCSLLVWHTLHLEHFSHLGQHAVLYYGPGLLSHWAPFVSLCSEYSSNILISSTGNTKLDSRRLQKPWFRLLLLVHRNHSRFEEHNVILEHFGHWEYSLWTCMSWT